MRLIGLFLALLAAQVLLPPEASAQRSGTVVSPQTGIFGSYTDQIVISRDAHHVLVGHIISVVEDGRHLHALVIQHRWDGVHRLSYSAAHAGGVRLPFRRLTGPGCTHGHCLDRPIGIIVLSPDLMERLAITGLRARLTGRSGAISLDVRARLFADGLAAARSAGLLPS